MDNIIALHELLERSAARFPGQVAVQECDGRTITYAELERLANLVRDRLRLEGVRPGDRVGMCLHKSIDAIASIFGILETGAAYVPIDPLAPAVRNAYILDNCAVRVLITESSLLTGLTEQLGRLNPALPPILAVEETGGGDGLRAMIGRDPPRSISETVAPAAPDDLAYILYTSGSTGKPKGVMLSQLNAMSFVRWCAETFEPTSKDCFSSHAPLHFDLSILDVFVSIGHGARLLLVAEDIGKDPKRLAPLISESGLTVWYSAPSILALLAQYGELERYDYSRLRTVLFAGEVFPVRQLRALRKLWPHPRYFNLYGPTETNVCTYHEVTGDIPEDRTEPFPIGRTCSHLKSRVVDDNGKDVSEGEEGELCIAGSGVMQGYWNLPDQTVRGFLPGSGTERWYRTGDLVVEEDGVYVFRGRRDRMIKKRGYRVELGEIEACLYGHDKLREVAVVAVPGDDGMQVKAFFSTRDGQRVSGIHLKQYCAERLPLYMVPDVFVFQAALPRTSTDKIDYQTLKGQA